MSEKNPNTKAQARVSHLCKDALFHAIRGLNEINNQSQGLWSSFNVEDCQYHLRVAIEYLSQIEKVVRQSDNTPPAT